jgi:hypothetical protein
MQQVLLFFYQSMVYRKNLILMALYHASPAKKFVHYILNKLLKKNAHGGERYNSNSMANHAFNLKLIWKLAI